MNVPIISVEWVGDMSVPSSLPNHKPFPSPEPGPAIKSLMTGVGEIEDEERKDATEDKDPPGQPSDSGSPVLVRRPNVSFSNKAQEQTPHSPAGQFPNGLQVSSSLLRRTIQWPKTDIFIRARNGTKTHSSPSTSSTRLFSSRELSDWPDHEKAQIQDARKWAHTRKAPAVTPRRARRVRASRKSSCCNQRSGSSEQEFFTPPSTRHPSTRKDKGKGKVFESSPAIESSVMSQKRHKPLRMSNDDTAASSYNVSGQGSRSVTRTTGSPGLIRTPRTQPTAAAIERTSKPSVPTVTAGPFSPDVSSSLSSRHIRHATSDIALNELIQAEFSASSGQKRTLADVSPAPTAAASSSHDFSSSLYSRPKSRVFRNHSKALDGGADAATPLLRSPAKNPRRSFSFDTDPHDAEIHAGQRYVKAKKSMVWTGGKREEISRLRNDNAALERQISNLCDEFRMLKNVLLQAESHRRWQECVS